MFKTLWEACNQDFHKNTTEQKDKSLKEQRMRKRVHSLYKESRHLATADKKLFPKNVNDVLSKQQQQMEKWTMDAGKVTQTAFEEEERTDNHPITNHFNTLPTPGPPNKDHGRAKIRPMRSQKGCPWANDSCPATVGPRFA